MSVQIRTPDYQGYADRVTPALDRLLIGYQERKQRQAEEREFTRRKTLMKTQQDFQREMAGEQRGFQREMAGEQQDFQREMTGVGHDFQREIFADKTQLQENILGIKLDHAIDQQDRSFEHAENMAETQHGYNTEIQGIRSANAQAERLQETNDTFSNDFKDEYQDLLDLAGAQYQTYMNEDGIPMVVVNGAGFEEENISYDEFKVRMGRHRQLYDRYKQAHQDRNSARRLSEDDGNAVHLSHENDDYRFYAYEEYRQTIQDALKTGNVNSYFSDAVLSDRFVLDTRQREAKPDLRGSWVKLLSSDKPMEMEVEGENFVFDFENMSYGTLQDNYDRYMNHEATVEAQERFQRHEPMRKNFVRFGQRLKERMELLDNIVTEVARDGGVGNITELRDMYLNPQVDHTDTSSYLRKSRSNNNNNNSGFTNK